MIKINKQGKELLDFALTAMRKYYQRNGDVELCRAALSYCQDVADSIPSLSWANSSRLESTLYETSSIVARHYRSNKDYYSILQILGIEVSEQEEELNV